MPACPAKVGVGPTVLPSAGVVTRKLDGEGTRVLAVARDVPGAERELSAILAAWGSARVSTLVGSGASESGVRAASHRYAIWHVAAHAVADGNDPLASHLASPLHYTRH